MKTKSSSSTPATSEAALSIRNWDRQAAAYIKLFSSILDEPPEVVAIALKARLPVVAAITADSSKVP